MYYTGVGSRKTPAAVLHTMRLIAAKLATAGWTLRSGGAQGADMAFESGATSKKIFFARDSTPAAMELAASVHPAWHRCPPYVKQLHARNCFQVLGSALDSPSKILICWTPDGATCAAECSIKTGGTGTAIRLAEKFGVPVRNLARPDHMAAALKYLAK